MVLRIPMLIAFRHSDGTSAYAPAATRTAATPATIEPTPPAKYASQPMGDVHVVVPPESTLQPPTRLTRNGMNTSIPNPSLVSHRAA